MVNSGPQGAHGSLISFSQAKDEFIYGGRTIEYTLHESLIGNVWHSRSGRSLIFQLLEIILLVDGGAGAGNNQQHSSHNGHELVEAIGVASLPPRIRQRLRVTSIIRVASKP